jgi:hypothetical protein
MIKKLRSSCGYAIAALVILMLLPGVGRGQASLPFSYDEGNPGTSVPGLTQNGLGSNYSSSPKMKFDTEGDYLILNFSGNPGTLTFNIKWNLSTSALRFPGDFLLQESSDGTTYSVVQLYNSTNGAALANGIVVSQTFSTLNATTRYLKWIYSVKTNGNIALGAITLAAAASAPTWTSGWPKAENQTPTGFTAKVNINTAGTSYFVVLPNGATAPTSAQVKAGTDADNAVLASNLKGTITCAAGSTEYTSLVTGLNNATTYDVYFVAEASTLLQASPTMVSVTTTSSATAPSVSSPTATSITNNSALLGGNVSSDGGSIITEKGTVWKTSAGVTITDNPLTTTGTTGVFSHSRTGLPAKTQIFYKAYAINAINTTLSAEASFYTLANEPSAHVGSFAAVAASSSAIDLTWTAATGADGYLIIMKQGSSAPSGTPADATAYSVGNAIGDGTLAAEVLSGIATSQTITGLTGSSQYYFTIIPYAFDGLNYQTYNYFTAATIPSATATTQDPPAITVLWDGGASTTSWSDAANWNGNQVPATTDLVILDNSLTSGTYSVVLPSGNVKTSIKRLSISPSNGNTITLTLPVTNTYGASNDAGFVVGDNTASTDDITINDGGILINASGGSTGNGIQVNALANGTLRINNGGKFIHNTTRSAAGTAAAVILSTVAGTETGIFEYDVPSGSNFAIGATGRTYGSFILSKSSGTITYTSNGSSPLTIKGNFSINSGVTYTTTMTGTMNIGGNLVNNGISLSIPSSQAVFFDGTNPQNISGTNNIAFGGAVSITNSSGIIINSNMGVTVSGTLTNSAGTSGLIINSGASLIQNSADVQATVNRTITDATDNKWHYFISPIIESVQASGTSCFAGAYVDRYNEPTGAWVRLNTDENVTSTQGYSLNYLAGSRDLVFTGTLKASPVTYTNLSFSAGAAGYGEGWNLIGNPYTCGINPALCAVPAGMNAFAYVWNGVSGNYSSLSIGSATNAGTIAAQQGFFVKTSSGTNALTLANASRVHGGTFLKNGNSIPEMLKLTISGNTYSDEATVRFDALATESFDQQYDAYKLDGLNEAPQLYSLLPGEKAAVNTLPSSEILPNVPLGLKVGAATTYTLTITGMESFDPATPIRLDDLKRGTSQDVRINPVYSFTAAPGDAENRFRLRFASAIGIDETATGNFSIFAAQGQVHIIPASPAEGNVYVYSVSGKLVAGSTLNTGETLIGINTPGVYLVKVVTSKTVTSGKVVIN